MTSIEINDCFDELKAENKRLEDELNFANKCLEVLNKIRFNLNEVMSFKVKSNELVLNQEVIRIFKALNNEFNKILAEKLFEESMNTRIDSLKQSVNNQTIISLTLKNALNINKSGQQIDSSLINSSTPSLTTIDTSAVKVTQVKEISLSPQKDITVSKSKLRSQSGGHPSERLHPCMWPGCEGQFENSYQLSTHMREVHKKMYIDPQIEAKLKEKLCIESVERDVCATPDPQQLNDMIQMNITSIDPKVKNKSQNIQTLKPLSNKTVIIINKRGDITTKPLDNETLPLTSNQLLDTTDRTIQTEKRVCSPLPQQSDYGSALSEGQPPHKLIKYVILKSNQTNPLVKSIVNPKASPLKQMVVHTNNKLNELKVETKLQKSSSSQSNYSPGIIYGKLCYKCLENDCNQCYESSYDLRKHQTENHSDVDPNDIINNYIKCFKCEYDLCGKDYNNESELNDHTMSFHMSKDNMFRCEYNNCYDLFVNTNTLKSHIKYSHYSESPIFKCNYKNCNFTTKDKCGLEFHQKSTHSEDETLSTCVRGHNVFYTNKDLICEWKDCGFKTQSKHQLREHHKRHSSEGNQFENHICGWPQCDQRFKYSYQLSTHIQEVHKKVFIEPKIEAKLKKNLFIEPYDGPELIYGKLCYKCSENNCNQYYWSVLEMQKHKLQRHPDIDTNELKEITIISNKCFKCEYDLCGKEYNNGLELNEHTMSVHMIEDKFKCNYTNCEKVFNNKDNLKSHQRSVHSVVQRFKCDYNDCTFSSNYNTSLKLHQKYVHSNDERPFVCSVNGCDKRFKTRTHLSSHLPIHTNKSPVVCPVDGCGKNVMPHRLATHLLFHSKEDLFCDWKDCHYKCKLTAHLKRHKQVVHSSVRNHVCSWPECDKRFKSSADLSKHEKTHTNDKKHSCDWPGCDYRAFNAGTIRNHMRKHTQEKPFHCQYPGCGFRTGFATIVRKHMRVMHKK